MQIGFVGLDTGVGRHAMAVTAHWEHPGFDTVRMGRSEPRWCPREPGPAGDPARSSEMPQRLSWSPLGLASGVQWCLVGKFGSGDSPKRRQGVDAVDLPQCFLGQLLLAIGLDCTPNRHAATTVLEVQVASSKTQVGVNGSSARPGSLRGPAFSRGSRQVQPRKRTVCRPLRS
jgi:hypothetical protein